MSKRRSENEWRTLIDEQATSGLTQRAFCDLRGIPLATFGYWKRKLRGKSVSPAMPTGPGADTEWIELPIHGAVAGGSWQIELDLGNGLCLRLRQS